MNMTTVAFDDFSSLSDICRPETVSVRVKSGAVAPGVSTVDASDVAGMALLLKISTDRPLSAP
jgi:hypothetical protein